MSSVNSHQIITNNHHHHHLQKSNLNNHSLEEMKPVPVLGSVSPPSSPSASDSSANTPTHSTTSSSNSSPTPSLEPQPPTLHPSSEPSDRSRSASETRSRSEERPMSDSSSQASSPSDLPHDIFTITDDVLAAQYNFEEEIGYGNWGSIWRVSNLHHRAISGRLAVARASGSTDSKTRSAPDVPNSSGSEKRSSTLAVKLVHRDKSSNTTAAKIKSLWGEFKILRQLKNNPHKNVLRVSSFIITPSYALLTMSYCPGRLPVRLGESSLRALKYMRGLLSGTDFLHRHGITHNDLKPANIVLSSDDQPVLIDFGFAVDYGSEHDPDSQKRKFWSSLSWGTPEYLSPQRARGEWHDERLSDIWSLGVTIYEIVVGRTPFEANETEEFLTKASLEVYYKRTLKGEFLGPHRLSNDLRDLLVKMLRPNPDERIGSCAEALQHRYLSRSSHNLPLPRSLRMARSLSPTRPDVRTLAYRRSNNNISSNQEVNLRMQNLKIESPSSSRVVERLTHEDELATPKANTHQFQSPQKAAVNGTPKPLKKNVLRTKSVNTPETPKSGNRTGQTAIKHKRVPVPKLDFKENEPIQKSNLKLTQIS